MLYRGNWKIKVAHIYFVNLFLNSVMPRVFISKYCTIRSQMKGLVYAWQVFNYIATHPGWHCFKSFVLKFSSVLCATQTGIQYKSNWPNLEL